MEQKLKRTITILTSLKLKKQSEGRDETTDNYGNRLARFFSEPTELSAEEIMCDINKILEKVKASIRNQKTLDLTNIRKIERIYGHLNNVLKLLEKHKDCLCFCDNYDVLYKQTKYVVEELESIVFTNTRKV